MRASLGALADVNVVCGADSLLLAQVFHLFKFAALNTVVGQVFVVALARQTDVLIVRVELVLAQLTFSVIPLLVAI